MADKKPSTPAPKPSGMTADNTSQAKRLRMGQSVDVGGGGPKTKP